MRHRNTKATLNRPADVRKAMVRNLITSLFLYGKVKTTGARARVLESEAEKLVSRVRKQDAFNAIRELQRVLTTENACKNAAEYLKTLKVTSGFTRSTKVTSRDGDGAAVVQVELIHPDKK